jgi:hypothetical protein
MFIRDILHFVTHSISKTYKINAMSILNSTEIYKSWLKILIHTSEFGIIQQFFEVGQSLACVKYQQIDTQLHEYYGPPKIYK